MFYFRIKEFCSILCIFGKTWLYIVLHDFYYSSIILGSFSILLFPKLCWHIGLTPNWRRVSGGLVCGRLKIFASLSKREGLHRTRYPIHVYCILWVDSSDLYGSCPQIIASEYTANAVINTHK